MTKKSVVPRNLNTLIHARTFRRKYRRPSNNLKVSGESQAVRPLHEYLFIVLWLGECDTTEKHEKEFSVIATAKV